MAGRVGDVVFYRALDHTQHPNFEFDVPADLIAPNAIFTPASFCNEVEGPQHGLWMGPPVSPYDPHSNAPKREL